MTATLQNFADAQQDMRFGYYAGAPGVFASALAWMAAGLVAIVVSPERGVLALLIGGMFIFPASVLFSKLLGRPGAHSRGNPLGTLAMEGTVLLLLCLPLAYAISLYRIEWFFPAMLLVIGGRYLTFATVYGNREFWALGGALALCGFALLVARATPAVGALAGGITELLFALRLFAVASRARVNPPPRTDRRTTSQRQ